MSVTEICLVIIAACFVFKTSVTFYSAFSIIRTVRKQILPLLNKIDGVLDNLTAITLSVRDQVDELKTVVDDVTYHTRSVAQEVRERILPTVMELINAFS